MAGDGVKIREGVGLSEFWWQCLRRGCAGSAARFDLELMYLVPPTFANAHALTILFFDVFCLFRCSPLPDRYITPEELLQQQQQEAAEKGEVAAPAKQIIVDMRGPQVRCHHIMHKPIRACPYTMKNYEGFSVVPSFAPTSTSVRLSTVIRCVLHFLALVFFWVLPALT